MKEAAGEANMTVITIVLIAIVLAVGTVIINNLMNTTGRKSACNEAGGTLKGSDCVVGDTSYPMSKCSKGGYAVTGLTSCAK